MESPLFMNDFLLLVSAIGSCIVGALCGWQLRSARIAEAAESAALLVVEESSKPKVPNSRPVLNVNGVRNEATFVSAFGAEHGQPSDDGHRFIDHEEPLANTYGPTLSDLSSKNIREVAERLMQMADRITADVDAHDAQLHEVSNSLHSNEAMPMMDFVLAAVERLVLANENMQSQLRESRDRIVDQARQIETAEHRANTDALTRIPNRRAFDAELASWKGQTPGVLALLDIDYFKKFNDEHGHRAGDEVLRSVAATLHAHLGNSCLVARYGGEEFALVFTNHRLENVLEMIESARQAIANHEARFEDKVFNVTCSLGVTRMVAGEPSIEWIQRADEALYLSKGAGRDCGHCIDCQTIGRREQPFRLGHTFEGTSRSPEVAVDEKNQPVPVRSINQTLLDRLPSSESLCGSYRELLQRLGKAPVKLSVLAISVAKPEKVVAARRDGIVGTRLAKLLELSQTFCRSVDRVGYQDERTLLICMPGIEHESLLKRREKLRDLIMTQLQVRPTEVAVGCASVETGDTFDEMVKRAARKAIVPA